MITIFDKKNRFLLTFLAILFVSVFFISQTSYAGGGTPPAPEIADSPCDPDYYTSLRSRAWLEAQREITQNQNLISKPDSVLEYTCFDRQLLELADHSKDMLSETQRWGTATTLIDMDHTLQNLVNNSLQAYFVTNFPHRLLGGRMPDEDFGAQVAGGNSRKVEFLYDKSAGTGLASMDYECDVMNEVWMYAKCMDFIDNEDEDGFYSFENYRDYEDSGTDLDRRHLPEIAGMGRCPAIKSFWENNIDQAWVDAETPWEEDPVNTYQALVIPGPSSAVCTASSYIFTGLIVDQGGGASPEQYAEAICLQPGCVYVPNTGSGIVTSGRCAADP